MALKAAFPSMTSTKDMKFYSSSSISSDEDPDFHLRISDDEDSNIGKAIPESISKETEDDILNKFKTDDIVESVALTDSEEILLEEIDDVCGIKNKNENNDKLPKNDKSLISIKEKNDDKNDNEVTPASKNDDVAEVTDPKISSCLSPEEIFEEKNSDQNSKYDEKEHLKNMESSEGVQQVSAILENDDLRGFDTMENVPSENPKKDIEEQKDQNRIEDSESNNKFNDNSENPKEMEIEEPSANEIFEENEKNENIEEHTTAENKESNTSKNEEISKSSDEQKELFKMQTMDTENLLDILDVKPVDEIAKEISSSDNSEKDENEDDCEEIDTDKPENMDFDDVEREQDENDAIDSIDIEENVLQQEETNFDTAKSTDAKLSEISNESSEKTIKNIACSTPNNDDKPAVTDNMMDQDLPKSENTSPAENLDLVTEKKDTKENDLTTSKSIKRSLTEAEIKHTIKRIKMIENKDYYENRSSQMEKLSKPEEEKILKKLNSIILVDEFMKSKLLVNLRRDHLEQLCLQKMCEAVMDKSEIGELRHQLRVQEQMIEHWRKEVTQLMKQSRDLETVNNRLMSDFKQRNERDKPIMPLKITRSVGLQVNPENIVFTNNKKKSAKSTAPAQTSASVPAALANMSPVVSQPKTTAKATTESVPQSVVSKSTEGPPEDKSLNTSSSFIDLTDEDDKKTNTVKKKSTGLSAVTSVIGTITSKAPTTTTMVTSTANNKSFRIVSPATGVPVRGGPRLMYLVNSPVQGIITNTTSPTKQSLIKVNGNGIIAQANNTRTVTVRNQSLLKPIQPVRPINTPNSPNLAKALTKHPAPLPSTPVIQTSIASRKGVPPKPQLQIRKNGNAIVLSWKMPYNLNNYETIASYQLYAYQETSGTPSTDMWRKVGDIKALALPMACTLTQFADGNKYHFAVRAVDILKRVGPFSDPGPILL